MKSFPALLSLLSILGSGCDSAPENQPLSADSADQKQLAPAANKPGQATDLSRVDCPHYLSMTPVDLRAEIKKACAETTTPDARAANPMCEAQRITEHCEQAQKPRR